jgi:uncharacterized protein (TIGR02001 family)
MKLSVSKTIVVSALALSGAAFAQTAAPAPDYTLAFNVGAVSDYRFRGISQSRLKPALQGGIDFAHKSGFYIGTWASTIKILEDIPGGDGPVEVDFYGGFKFPITDSFGADIGLLRYQYPGENFATTPNTTEIYGALTFGPATLKYSHGITDETFGIANSKGSNYLELGATFDLGSGWSIVPHIGHQKFKGAGNDVASYTDYYLAVNKDFGNGFVASATLVGTDANKTFYASPANGKFLGKDGVVLGIKYNF